MNILLLTPQLPFPPTSGGLIKSHRLVEYLAGEHSLTVACFLKGQDEAYLNEFEQSLDVVDVYALRHEIPRTPWHFLRSCFAGVPLTILRNRNSEFASQIERLAKDADVLFVDHYLMFQYVPMGFKGRVVVHQHNAEYLMWKRRAELESRFWLRAVLSFEAWRIQKVELDICRRADVVMATCNDQEALRAIGADGSNFVETLHCGDEQNLMAPAICFSDTQPQLLFIGTMSWEANLDGLMWFLEEVWPQLECLEPGIGLTVVGKMSPDMRAQLSIDYPTVRLAGFVDDLEALYRRHRVFVAPLRFGSGVKIKVVNSLLRGSPTVTTPVGAEGLNVEDGEHIFIRESAEGFAAAVSALLRDEPLWQTFSEQSRCWMEQHYTWQQECKNLQRSLGL